MHGTKDNLNPYLHILIRSVAKFNVVYTRLKPWAVGTIDRDAELLTLFREVLGNQVTTRKRELPGNLLKHISRSEQ